MGTHISVFTSRGDKKHTNDLHASGTLSSSATNFEPTRCYVDLVVGDAHITIFLGSLDEAETLLDNIATAVHQIRTSVEEKHYKEQIELGSSTADTKNTSWE